MWNSVEDGLPPLRKHVIVMTKENWIPLVGYVKDNGEGPYWVIPGRGGTVEFWADAIPIPLPDSQKENFRRHYEGVSA